MQRARIASAAMPRPSRPAARHARVRAADPRRFGRRRSFALITPAEVPASTLSADLKLFASTFAAGFLFVSVFIA